jgi:hypothetical protein
MKFTPKTDTPIPPDLVDSIASFPVHREVSHCGESFQVAPFDIYANCPRCGARIKIRAFSGGVELADVFDAVFTWMKRPGAAEAVRRRQQAIEEDQDE